MSAPAVLRARGAGRARAAGDAAAPVPRRDVAIVGAGAALIAFAGSWVPALWRDEVATVGGALRTWPALAGMAGHVDAVHALYYAGMHLWFAVVGYSPLTLRLPSALAVGASAAVVTALGGSLAGRRAGLASGAVAALLPSLVWAGGEGRSYAFTALLATLATAALVHALQVEGPGVRAAVAWAGYAALIALAGAIFLDDLLLVGAHLVTAVLLGSRRGLIRAAAAAAAAVVAVLPLLRLATAQTAQVAWIADYRPDSPVHQVAVEQWFRSDAVAWTALAVLVAGAAAGVARSGRPAVATPVRRLLAVALPWAVLPTAALLVASLAGTPLYWPRYVTFTAPAVALLLGLAVATLPSLLPVLALAVLAAVASPQIVADRQPRAKAQSELGLAAQLVGSARAATPGEGRAGIVYGGYDRIDGLTTGMTAIAYPSAFRGLTDLTATAPITASTELFEPRTTPEAAVPRMASLHTVWFLLDMDSEPKTRIPVAGLRALGFSETGAFRIPGSLLLRWSR